MNEPDAVAAVVRKRWCEVLQKTAVNDQDDFFLSGGYSLLAIRLTNVLRDDLEITLPVSVLFRNRVLAGYIEQVQQQARPEA